MTEHRKRPRVLAIAEAANPEWVSVPLVGWSLADALRNVADVHLVTQVRNRDAILRAGYVEGRDFTAIDSEAIARPVWAVAERLRGGGGKGWTTLQAFNALMYPYFERLVWKQFGTAIQRGDYDVVHRITPLSPTLPSSIAPKCARAGVPFVLGPLNGGVPWPAGFDAERRQEKEWLSYLRSAYKLMPGRDRTLRSAAAILVGSRHTQSEVPERYQPKTVYIPENGVDPKRFNAHAGPAANGPLRACFVGRLVPYKGADMLIKAAAPLLADGRMTLDIIGDGPVMGALKEQAANLGGAVTFHGWLAHHAVQDVMARCHLFTFPSIREFGGGVVLEAMALGVPPMVVDYAGPGELVRPGTGITVPCGTRDQIVAGFRSALQNLCEDRCSLVGMAQAGRQMVQEHYLWSRKAAQVRQVYDWVTGQREDKPQPFS
ncbi:MAG: glycosyltransferase family 4 protein [Roseivivax sp.]|nr:glycosyltransferase family 4 protein [Roseivivax sp.]